MNEREFRVWQTTHAAHFPDWASWIANRDRDNATNPLKPGTVAVLVAMQETLADVSLADAKEASRRLGCGDEPEIDSFDAHARRVREVARRFSSERIKALQNKEVQNLTAERVFKCSQCEDWGFVEVWQPQAVKAARDPKLRDKVLNGTHRVWTCAVACNCQLGAKKRNDSEKPKYVGLSVFMQIVPNSFHWPERLRDLVEFANSKKQNEWTGD